MGYQVVPDAGVTTEIGRAGTPVIIYGVNWEGVGAAQSIYFTNGSIAGPFSNQDVFQTSFIASGVFKTELFIPGVVFPLGCMIGGDAGGGRATVFFKQV